MKFVKITPDYACAIDNVKSISNYKGRKIESVVRDARANETLIDITGGKKINTVIILKDGDVIVTNSWMDTIIRKLEGSDM